MCSSDLFPSHDKMGEVQGEAQEVVLEEEEDMEVIEVIEVLEEQGENLNVSNWDASMNAEENPEAFKKKKGGN